MLFRSRVTGPLVADMHDTMTRLWWRMQVTRETSKYDFEAAIRAARVAASAGVDMGDTAVDSSALSDMPDSEAEAAPPGTMAALVLRDNVRFRRRIEGTYRIAIAQAQSEILIANAYFIPGVQLQRALLRAAKRGVRVTLLLQAKYEYFMQYHASRAVYGSLLKAGIQIIEYEASFLHAKVAVMDAQRGALATVGVHIVGEGATELIHIGQAVLNLGGTLDYFVENTFNYPTLAEAYKIAALDAWNRMPRMQPSARAFEALSAAAADLRKAAG